MAQLTMYSTQWCGYCQRLKAQLGREGITYTEIDIEHDAVTNPSLGQVKEKLGL